jgi:hypothetical protein
MAAAKKMFCPKCRAEMNHHAEKVVYASKGYDPIFEERVVEEVFACPNCSASASRVRVG